jgi:ankyrin repeat protein
MVYTVEYQPDRSLWSRCWLRPKLLIEAKADVNFKDETGQTPLSWAARNGRKAMVKLLLETGKVEVDARDVTYRPTPMSCAVEKGHDGMVKLLQSTSAT